MRRPLDHRRKRKAPPGKSGASEIDCSGEQLERPECNSPIGPAATPAENLISISEACRRSGEKPATVLTLRQLHAVGR